MSEEQERSKQEEHWRELAQLLGIGPDAPAAKPVAARTPAPPPVEAKAPPPPPPEPAPVMASVAEFHEEVVVTPIVEETSVEEPPLSDLVTGEETETSADWREAEEEDRPRRGKRRRGRRGRREEPPRPRMEEKAPDLEATEEEPPFPEDSDDGEEETEDAAEPVEAQTEEDLDVDDTLRDWNVPSWNELIASLYRPDR
jgi:hypothetical protein